MDMDVYTALLDEPGQNSVHIGVFSTEPKARQKCHDYAEEQAGVKLPAFRWKDDSTTLPDGKVYVVVMTRLDVPTGMG